MSKFMNIPIFITLIIFSIGCIILHIVTFKRRYKVVFNKIEDRFPISLSSSNSYSSTYKDPLKETYDNLKNENDNIRIKNERMIEENARKIKDEMNDEL